MAHWDKEDVFLAQLDDPSNTCCVLPKKCLCALNIFIFRWHNLMTFMTVAVITWAGHTRHMTGPHTKYFPTYFYNPDIFCLPFISFLLTGCSQDRWMHNASLIAWHTHDIRKQPRRKLMNVFVWSWHRSHPGIIGPHWHRAPGDRWWWPGIVCQQVPADFMIHHKPDVHKTRALIHTGAPGAN